MLQQGDERPPVLNPTSPSLLGDANTRISAPRTGRSAPPPSWNSPLDTCPPCLLEPHLGVKDVTQQDSAVVGPFPSSYRGLLKGKKQCRWISPRSIAKVLTVNEIQLILRNFGILLPWRVPSPVQTASNILAQIRLFCQKPQLSLRGGQHEVKMTHVTLDIFNLLASTMLPPSLDGLWPPTAYSRSPHLHWHPSALPILLLQSLAGLRHHFFFWRTKKGGAPKGFSETDAGEEKSVD